MENSRRTPRESKTPTCFRRQFGSAALDQIGSSNSYSVLRTLECTVLPYLAITYWIQWIVDRHRHASTS
ncbi:hypothetical protein TMatcc_009851 [Talaromyces marneffei ATCC 18224]